MSANTVRYAIEDAVAAVQGIRIQSGLNGLRGMNADDAGWQQIAREWFPSHAPANFLRNKGRTLPPEDAEQYVEAFVIAAQHCAEMILTDN